MMIFRFALASALACAATFTAATPAAAVEYPWCASVRVLGGGDTKICTFDTLEQCLVEVRGLGGNCSINPYIREEDYSERRRPRRAPPR
jgi:hypothetical protein